MANDKARTQDHYREMLAKDNTVRDRARLLLTPALMTLLHEVVIQANVLMSELRSKPGIGIGLQYAPMRRACDDVDQAMMKYQNSPTHTAREARLMD